MNRPVRSRIVVVAGALVLLGGGATGAAVGASLIDSADIANNSIRSIDVKNGALTGKDVKDGSLTAADFGGQLGSAVGPQGPQGPVGPPGAKGEPGVLPGKTVGWSVTHPGGGTPDRTDGQLLATSSGTIDSQTRVSTVTLTLAGNVTACDNFFLVDFVAVDQDGYAVRVGTYVVSGPSASEYPDTVERRGQVASLVGPAPSRLEARGWCYSSTGGLLPVPAGTLTIKLRVEPLSGQVDETL